jgi:hypothetical protein
MNVDQSKRPYVDGTVGGEIITYGRFNFSSC